MRTNITIATLFVSSAAIAGTTVGYRQIDGTNVTGDVTLTERLTMDPSGTFLKTGSGTLDVPASQVDAQAPWSMDVIGGKLKLSGTASARSVDDVPAAMQKATLWLDVSNLPDGDLATWNDCRDNGYSAVARQYRAETVSPPVVRTVNGVKCIDFGGLSEKYMRFQKNGSNTTISNVRHWFFVYGFSHIASPFFGCDSDYKWDRGKGLLTAFGSDSVLYFDNSVENTILYSGRGDAVNRDITARHWIDGVRIDPFSRRPKKGFQLIEGDQQNNEQTFQTIFFKYSELFNSASGRVGGDYVCEAVLFTTAITEEERLAVERYLMSKWSLPRTKSYFGNESIGDRTGDIRVAPGATAEVDVPDGGESLPLAFCGGGDIVKKGSGTLVIGPSADGAASPSMTLEGGDVLLRGGIMPAVTAKGGESWTSAVSPVIRQTTVETCEKSGFRITKGEASAGTFVKSGFGDMTVGKVDGSVRTLRVEDGILRLAANEGDRTDTGIGETSVYIPNASFEMPFVPDGDRARGMWDKTINEWYGLATYFVTQCPALSAYLSYYTPCGSNAMMVVSADGVNCSTLVTFPRAGTYELSLWSAGRFDTDKRECVDISYNGKRIGHLQVRGGPFALYRFRFDIPEEDAGAANRLKFAGRYKYEDSNTVIDGLQIHPVARKVRGEFKVPNGDFDRRNRVNSGEGMVRKFSRAVTHDGWTLSLEGSPSYTDDLNGYISFCTAGVIADKMDYYPVQDLGVGSGALGFFHSYGRATSAAFTLPAGRWLLRADIAKWMTYLDATPSGGYIANPSVGAWIKRGEETVSLGTITTASHQMQSYCWPKVIDVAADESVQVIVGNTVDNGSGVLDNLVFVPADVASGNANLVKDGGCEMRSQWTKIQTSSRYDRGDAEWFSNGDNSDAWGANAFDGDFCLRLHNTAGMSTKVTFPAPGLYRLTFHARPRPDGDQYSLNPVRAYVRLGDGTELEIFRQKRMERFWRYAEYTALFEIPADKLPSDGVLTLGFHGLGRDGDAADADRNTFVDGVSVVKVDPAGIVTPTVHGNLRVSVGESAKIELDYPGTNTVRALFLDGVQQRAGVYSAATSPDYITGMGAIEVKPQAFSIIVQ